jgi:hypothetical protein
VLSAPLSTTFAMKNRIALIAAYVCVFAIFPAFNKAQSITINAVSGTQFCAGEGVTVNFAATPGFKRKNAFTLQLSDVNGSFQSGFRNLGSIFDSLPGVYSIRVAIPTDIQTSAKYRFRILAAVPFTTSADNGKDVSIGSTPWIGGFRTSASFVVAGEPVTFALDQDSLSDANTYEWDFGADAIPSTAVGSVIKDVVFMTGGPKNIAITAIGPVGCTNSTSTIVDVLGCSPKITDDAIVVKENTYGGKGSGIFWVNPGVTFTAGGSNIVFAEPGSTVSVQGSCTIYLKRGASCIGTGGSCIIFYEDGASIPDGFTNAKLCSGLDFDYTDAPPNIIQPLSVVNDNAQSMAFFPNPSNGNFTISGMPTDVQEIAVYDVLGARVAKLDNPAAISFQVNLGAAMPGSYYVRITTEHSVTTRKIVVQR